MIRKFQQIGVISYKNNKLKKKEFNCLTNDKIGARKERKQAYCSKVYSAQRKGNMTDNNGKYFFVNEHIRREGNQTTYCLMVHYVKSQIIGCPSLSAYGYGR